MEFADFYAKPKLDFKVFALNGDEEYFKFLAKVILVKSFKNLELNYVDSEDEDFYSKIEGNDLIPHPKIFYIDNASGHLSKLKYFWKYVKDSPEDSRYIINGLNSKAKEDIDVLEIKCSKIKDSPREVGKFVSDMVKSLQLAIPVTDLPYFHNHYRNNLFSIFNELKKCQLWADYKGSRYMDAEVLKGILSPSLDKDPFAFSNAFLQRRLKAAIPIAPTLNDMPLQMGSVFSGAEKLLVVKCARRSGMGDAEIEKAFELNHYYFTYTIKPMEKLWAEKELKLLLVDIEALNRKMRSFNFPVTKNVIQLIFKYCR